MGKAAEGEVSLRLVSLGCFDVLAQGRSRLTSPKLPRSPIALAVCLVAAGPVGEGTEILADRLWPEIGEAAARKRMKSTVYRLRRLLGDPGAVHTLAGRIALNAGRIAVDAWELEALRAAPEEADEARMAAVLALYGGPFVHHLAGHAGLLVYANSLDALAVGVCADRAAGLLRAGEAERALQAARDALYRVGDHRVLHDLAAEAEALRMPPAGGK